MRLPLLVVPPLEPRVLAEGERECESEDRQDAAGEPVILIDAAKSCFAAYACRCPLPGMAALFRHAGSAAKSLKKRPFRPFIGVDARKVAVNAGA